MRKMNERDEMMVDDEMMVGMRDDNKRKEIK